MSEHEQASLLADHHRHAGRSAGADETPADRNKIVQLSPDHPGFRDPAYRARRNRHRSTCFELSARREIPERLTLLRNTGLAGCFGTRLSRHTAPDCAEYQASVPRLAFAPDRIRSCANKRKGPGN